MKKITTILLLFAFIINIMGIFPVFKLMQYQARKEIKKSIKSNLPINKLHTIVICNGSENELKWEREDKEFFYKGNLYDIVRVVKTEKKTIYLCINDTEEKQLFANLDELTKKEINKDKFPLKNVVKRLLKHFSQIKPTANHLAFNLKTSYKHNTIYLLNLPSGFKDEVQKPPGQNLV